MIYKLKGRETPVQVAEIEVKIELGHTRLFVNDVHVLSLTDSGKLYKRSLCGDEKTKTGLTLGEDDTVAHY